MRISKYKAGGPAGVCFAAFELGSLLLERGSLGTKSFDRPAMLGHTLLVDPHQG